MKVYTVTSLLSIAIVLLVDKFTHTNLLRQKNFWKLQGIVVVLTAVTDNCFSGLPVSIFNPSVISNIKIGHSPIENYFFGFSLITFDLILFELLNNRKNEE